MIQRDEVEVVWVLNKVNPYLIMVATLLAAIYQWLECWIPAQAVQG